MRLLSISSALFVAALNLGAQQISADAQRALNASKPVTTEAKVEQVFFLQEDGFIYRAYMVEYHGAKIIVNDLTSKTNYSIGDNIKFGVMKTDLSKLNPAGSKMISFNVLY